MSVVIRKGEQRDTEALIRFLEEVRTGMEHKEWFYLDPPEDVRRFMKSGEMQLWVAMDGEQVAAILDILIPGLAEYNYGYDLGFSQEELMRVIHMDSAAVHPDYRGQGLQGKLIRTAEEALSGQGERILLCTVHPENHFSLQNVRRQGYTIQQKREKYGSVRYILRKDIS